MKRFGAVFRMIAVIGVCGGTLLGSVACTSNSAKKHYMLAEKLWMDGKYSSAVGEFDKVTAKDPRGKLGLQALFRSATTQALFLSQYSEAIRKYETYAETPGVDAQLAWDAKKQVGEILFSKTDQYDRAITHYRNLLKESPRAPEAAEFSFRVAKSHFFLWQFDEAVSLFRKIIVDFPGTTWAEKSAYEIGVTFYTRGEQLPGGNVSPPPPPTPTKSHRGREKGVSGPYADAIHAYQGFIQQYPKSEFVPLARFGIANCLEEMDQLDAAYQAYEELKSSYPSPNVIEIKLVRIRERQAQRSR